MMPFLIDSLSLCIQNIEYDESKKFNLIFLSQKHSSVLD